MKFYNNTPRLVTLEGDCEEIGVLPVAAVVGLKRLGKRIFGRIKKRIRAKRKRRSKGKAKAQRARIEQQRQEQFAFQEQQRILVDQEKNKKQKQLLTLAIPAGIAAMMLLGKDK